MRIQNRLFHVSVGAARERVAETLEGVVVPAAAHALLPAVRDRRGAAGQPGRSVTGSRARRAGAGPTERRGDAGKRGAHSQGSPALSQEPLRALRSLPARATAAPAGPRPTVRQGFRLSATPSRLPNYSSPTRAPPGSPEVTIARRRRLRPRGKRNSGLLHPARAWQRPAENLAGLRGCGAASLLLPGRAEQAKLRTRE